MPLQRLPRGRRHPHPVEQQKGRPRTAAPYAKMVPSNLDECSDTGVMSGAAPRSDRDDRPACRRFGPDGCRGVAVSSMSNWPGSTLTPFPDQCRMVSGDLHRLTRLRHLVSIVFHDGNRKFAPRRKLMHRILTTQMSTWLGGLCSHNGLVTWNLTAAPVSVISTRSRAPLAMCAVPADGKCYRHRRVLAETGVHRPVPATAPTAGFAL